MADEKETNAENAEAEATEAPAPNTEGGEANDPMAEYAELKAEREAEKAAPPKNEASQDEAKGEDAPAEAAADKAEEAPKAEAVSADPMPHPIEEYNAYKAWKARQKSKGGKKVAVAEGEDGLRKPGGKYAGKVKAREESRRNVLFTFGGIMWLTFAGAAGALGAVVGRFLFPNVLYEPPTTFKIGSPSQFLPNSVDTSYKGAKQIWVVRDELGIYVIKAVCTHLGCTPNWLATENKFKCPCHGSGFRMTGMNFEGPAPRPLERFKVAVANDGQIVVDTSKVFLQEAQWTNPEAYIPA